MKNNATRIITILIMASVIGFLFSAAPAYAEQAVTVSDINLGLVGEEDFANGYVFLPRVPVFWDSDVPWRLTIQSLGADLGAGDDGMTDKSLSDLLWKLSDEENWLPVTQDPEEVEWSMESGTGVVYIDLVVLIDWLYDSPGQYQVDLTFRIEILPETS